jgi:outer membrane receptor protein involved in Fe transport
LPGEIRDGLFGRFEYEVTDNLKVFAQASYNKFIGLNYYITHANINNVRLQADNAYLPPEIRSQLPAGSSIVIGTSNYGWPTWGANNEREVTRLVGGAKGKFNALERDWNWDAYVQRGQAKVNEELINTYSNYRIAQAQDAVVAPAGNPAGIPAGTIVCRSTLTSPTNGCVPLNRLGTGGALTRAAFDYLVYDNTYRKQTITQTVAAVTFSGEVFDLPAGAVAVALGAEAREEKIDGFVPPEFGPAGTIVTSDPTCVTNPAGLTRGTDGKPIPCTNQGWEAGNYLVNKGKYTVQEAFIEVEVPIFEGLSVNGAGRYTHYSTSGGVFTWKVGSTWQVLPDIKLRGTISRDIRAPNLDELFAAGTGRSNAVTINNTSFAYVQFATGNRDLRPEVADSYNIGAVMTPQFAPGLTFAVDYYKIAIKDAIGSLVPQDVVDLCYIQANVAQCENIIGPRVGGGPATALPTSITRINLKPFNFAKQDLSGVDLEASYRTDLDQFIENAPGSLTLRAMVTHYIENVTDRGIPGSFPRDEAGSRSQPAWNYRVMANYAQTPWNFNVVARGISPGKVDNSYFECASACPASNAEHRTINDNRLPGGWWIDTAISRDFELAGRKAQLQFAIRNLLDKDPPNTVNSHLPSESSASTPAFPQTLRIYDLLGRTFKLSLEIEL